jgi:hypothetical protein
MRQVINEPVSVYFMSDPGTAIKPLYLNWRKRAYKVEQLSHSFTAPGASLSAGGKYHIYCLVADGQYFEVLLDPLTMVFILREIHDGLAD